MMSKIQWSIFTCHCLLIAFWIVYFYNSAVYLRSAWDPDASGVKVWLMFGKMFGGIGGLTSSVALATETLAQLTLATSGCCNAHLYRFSNLFAFMCHFLGLTTWFTAFILDHCFTRAPSSVVPIFLCTPEYSILHFLIFFGVFAEIMLGISVLALYRHSIQFHGYESI
ncbi:hypothetical protein DMENIID0001_139240 [Sergentomyia squamirostris]